MIAVNRLAPPPTFLPAPALEPPGAAMPPPAAGADRDTLRQLALYAARSLLGGGPAALYPGKVVVKLVAPDDGAELKLVPTSAADGFTPPADLISAAADVAAEAAAVAAAVPPPPESANLLASFLSRDEVRILVSLDHLTRDKPACKAADVHFHCKIEKSKFWVLWSNLQHRRLVEDGPDDEGGFVIAAAWVRGMLPEPVAGQ